MSLNAPWIRLASDFLDSEMFEGLEGPEADSIRLAWVMLLCHAKQAGRGGRVVVRPAAFARRYGLEGGERAVERLLEIAAQARQSGASPALRRNGDIVQLENWNAYQGHRGRENGDPDSASGPMRRNGANAPQRPPAPAGTSPRARWCATRTRTRTGTRTSVIRTSSEILTSPETFEA